MKRLIKTTALAAVAGALLSLPASGALVNGSFENTGNTWAASYYNSGFGAMIVPQNSTVIPGWTVQNGQLDWDQSGAFGLFAQDGSYYLDLTDDEQTGPAGVAQTSISTIPNATYHISGWLGSSSVYNPGTTQPTITVNIDGNNVQTFTGIGYQAPATSYWQEFGLDFIATGSTTLLALQGGTVGTGNNYYIGLDNISVSMVPEPTTMIAGALLLLPFGASTLRVLRKKRMAGLIGVGALVLGLLASGGSAKANLIVNGSFELGGFVPNGDNTMDLPSGSTVMTGWTVTTANLAWIGPGNPFGLSASDGSYFLDLSGYHDNQPYGGVAASTGISTVIGQQYNVAFDVGSDVVYDTVSPSVQVTLNGNPPTGTFTAGPIASVHNRWETFDFAFTATSANTVITFQGVGADNQKYIGLDNVVVSAVPEPTTMLAGALLLLPFGASTLRILRKNRAP